MTNNRSESLTFGSEVNHEADQQRILILPVAEFVAMVKIGLIGPITAILKAGQEAFHHLVLESCSELLESLRFSGDEALAVIINFEAARERPLVAHLVFVSEGDTPPIVAGAALYLVVAVVE